MLTKNLGAEWVVKENQVGRKLVEGKYKSRRVCVPAAGITSGSIARACHSQIVGVLGDEPPSGGPVSIVCDGLGVHSRLQEISNSDEHLPFIARALYKKSASSSDISILDPPILRYSALCLWVLRSQLYL